MLGPRGEAVGTHHGDGEGVDSGQFGEPPAKKDGWMYLRGWFGADFSPNPACFWAVFFGLISVHKRSVLPSFPHNSTYK